MTLKAGHGVECTVALGLTPGGGTYTFAVYGYAPSYMGQILALSHRFGSDFLAKIP